MIKEVVIDGSLYYHIIDWEEVHHLINKVGKEIERRGYEPTIILGVLRNGATVANLLSDWLGNHAVLTVGAKFYIETRKTGEKVVITQPLTKTNFGKDHVLLVDDISDTGKTWETVTQHIYSRRESEQPLSLLSVFLYRKSPVPVIYGREVDRKWWVWFPWEPVEVVTDAIKNLHKRGYTLEESTNLLRSELKNSGVKLEDYIFERTAELAKHKIQNKK